MTATPKRDALLGLLNDADLVTYETRNPADASGLNAFYVQWHRRDNASAASAALDAILGNPAAVIAALEEAGAIDARGWFNKRLGYHEHPWNNHGNETCVAVYVVAGEDR